MAHGFPESLLFAIAENPAASEAFRETRAQRIPKTKLPGEP